MPVTGCQGYADSGPIVCAGRDAGPNYGLYGQPLIIHGISDSGPETNVIQGVIDALQSSLSEWLYFRVTGGFAFQEAEG